MFLYYYIFNLCIVLCFILCFLQVPCERALEKGGTTRTRHASSNWVGSVRHASKTARWLVLALSILAPGVGATTPPSAGSWCWANATETKCWVVGYIKPKSFGWATWGAALLLIWLALECAIHGFFAHLRRTRARTTLCGLVLAWRPRARGWANFRLAEPLLIACVRAMLSAALETLTHVAYGFDFAGPWLLAKIQLACLKLVTLPAAMLLAAFIVVWRRSGVRSHAWHRARTTSRVAALLDCASLEQGVCRPSGCRPTECTDSQLTAVVAFLGRCATSLHGLTSRFGAPSPCRRSNAMGGLGAARLFLKQLGQQLQLPSVDHVLEVIDSWIDVTVETRWQDALPGETSTTPELVFTGVIDTAYPIAGERTYRVPLPKPAHVRAGAASLLSSQSSASHAAFLRDRDLANGPLAYAFVGYGSRGDIAPFEAAVARLKIRRVHASIVTPIDVQRGTTDLHAIENGDMAPAFASVLVVTSATTTLQGTRTRVVVGAAHLAGAAGGIVVSLEPPPDCAKPVQVGDIAFDIGSAMKDGGRRVVPVIGERLDGLPRLSANGCYFRRTFSCLPRRKRKHQVGIAMGSSGIPVPAEFAQRGLVVPSGDHAVLFRDYDEIWCHGGAGTVCTAIAAGCKVHSFSRALDRRWRSGAEARLSLHGDDVFLLGAMIAANPADAFGPLLRGVEPGFLAVVLLHALWCIMSYVHHFLTAHAAPFAAGWRDVAAVLQVISAAFNAYVPGVDEHATPGELVSNSPAIIAVVTGLTQGSWPRAMSGSRTTDSATDALMIATYALITDTPILGLVPDASAVALPDLGMSLLAVQGRGCETFLVFSAVLPVAPWYHVAFEGPSETFDVTETNLVLKPRVYASGRTDTIFRVGFVGDVSRAREVFAAHGGLPYGVANNCLTVALAALVLNPRPWRSACQIILLCALLAVSAPPLSAADIANACGSDGVVLANLIRNSVRLSDRPTRGGRGTRHTGKGGRGSNRSMSGVATAGPIAAAAARQAVISSTDDTGDDTSDDEPTAPPVEGPADRVGGMDVEETITALRQMYASTTAGANAYAAPAPFRLIPSEARAQYSAFEKAISRKPGCQIGQERYARQIRAVSKLGCAMTGEAISTSECALCARWRSSPVSLGTRAIMAFFRHVAVEPEEPYSSDSNPTATVEGWAELFGVPTTICHYQGNVFVGQRTVGAAGAGDPVVVTLNVAPDGTWEMSERHTRAAGARAPGPPGPGIDIAPPPAPRLDVAKEVARLREGSGWLEFAQRAISRTAPACREALLGAAHRYADSSGDFIDGAATLLARHSPRDYGPAPEPFEVRGKPAWTIQAAKVEKQPGLFHLRSLLSTVITIAEVNPEMDMIALIERLNDLKPEHQPPLQLQDFSRPVRAPALDEYGRERAMRALKTLDAEVGANCLAFATAENVKASLSRYEGLDEASDDIDIDEAVKALTDHVPGCFDDSRLRDPRFVARGIVMKYSCGIPFIGQEGVDRNGASFTIRKRSDLFNTGWIRAVVGEVRRQLETGDLRGDQHHSFVKNYIQSLEKLDANGAKIRTVVAQTLVAYLRTMVFEYTLNKKMTRMYDIAPWKVGMTASGGGYNRMLASAPEGGTFVAFDMTGCDATVKSGGRKLLSALRSHGFRDNAQSREITMWIEANYETLGHGTIYDLTHGVIINKTTGLSTGSASTPSNNNFLVPMVMAHIYRRVHPEKTYADFYREVWLSNMGDDGLMRLAYAKELFDQAAWVGAAADLGMILRIEGVSSTLAGLSFCRKSILPEGAYADDFEAAGISPPKFVIQHDPASIAMRQTAAANGRGAEYYAERTLGHILLCSHNRATYDWLVGEMARLRPMLQRTKRGRWLLRARPTPSYETVIRLSYMEPRAKARIVYPDALWDRYLMFETGLTGAVRQLSIGLRRLKTKHLRAEFTMLGTGHALNPPLSLLALAIRDISPRVTTREGFRTRLSSGPASSVVDTDRFWDEIGATTATPAGLDPAGVIMVYELLTLGLIALHSSLKSVPIFAPIIAIYELIYFDGTHLYGATSGPYYAARGGPSAYLGSMVPKDPWAFHKRISCYGTDIAALLPLTTQVLGYGSRLIAWAVDEASLLGAPHMVADDRATTHRALNVSRVWDALWRDRIAGALLNNRVMLTAVTGSGKSRFMPPAALSTFLRVILLVPRRALAAQTDYLWVKKGTPLPATGIVVMTYGYFVARSSAGTPFLTSGENEDLVIADESHSREPEVIAALSALSSHRYLIVCSATPGMDKRYASLGRMVSIDAGIPRKYHNRIEERWGMSPIAAVRLALARQCKQILVIMPTIAGVDALARECDAFGIENSTFTASRSLSISRVIIASQVADSGVNIPRVDCVIDSARMIVQHRGTTMEIGVDINTAHQREGRGARDCDSLTLRLGPADDIVVETYPTTDGYLSDPGLWSDIYGISSDLQPIDGPAGSALYKVRPLALDGHNSGELKVLARFMLRYATPQDAAEGVAAMAADPDLHADLFGNFARLRSALTNNPRLISTFVERSPLLIRRNGRTLNVKWLRVRDGGICTDAERTPLLVGARAKAVMGHMGDAVDAEVGLPGAARYAPRPLANPRTAARVLHACFDIEVEDKVLTAVMRRIPARDLIDTDCQGDLRRNFGDLAQLLGVAVYFEDDSDLPTVLLNRHAPLCSSLALISATMSGGVRVAWWDRASAFRPVVFAPIDTAPKGGSQSAVAFRSSGTWRKTPSGWSGVLTGSSACTALYIATVSHVVRVKGPGCGYNAVAVAAGIGPPDRGSTNDAAEDIAAWALVELGLTLCVLQEDSPDGTVTWYGPDPVADQTRRYVVLRFTNGHYDLCVMPNETTARQLHPLSLQPARVIAIGDRGPAPPTSQKTRGLALEHYLGDSHGDLTADPWLSWSDMRKVLMRGSGTLPRHHAPTLQLLPARDRERGGWLADWSSFNRVPVRVRTSTSTDDGDVIILPNLECQSHSSVRFGRFVTIELGGGGGARLYRAANVAARGIEAFRAVYSPALRRVFRQFDVDWIATASLNAAATGRESHAVSHEHDGSSEETPEPILARENRHPQALVRRSIADETEQRHEVFTEVGTLQTEEDALDADCQSTGSQETPNGGSVTSHASSSGSWVRRGGGIEFSFTQTMNRHQSGEHRPRPAYGAAFLREFDGYNTAAARQKLLSIMRRPGRNPESELATIVESCRLFGPEACVKLTGKRLMRYWRTAKWILLAGRRITGAANTLRRLALVVGFRTVNSTEMTGIEPIVDPNAQTPHEMSEHLEGDVTQTESATATLASSARGPPPPLNVRRNSRGHHPGDRRVAASTCTQEEAVVLCGRTQRRPATAFTLAEVEQIATNPSGFLCRMDNVLVAGTDAWAPCAAAATRLALAAVHRGLWSTTIDTPSAVIEALEAADLTVLFAYANAGVWQLSEPTKTRHARYVIVAWQPGHISLCGARFDLLEGRWTLVQGGGFFRPWTAVVRKGGIATNATLVRAMRLDTPMSASTLTWLRDATAVNAPVEDTFTTPRFAAPGSSEEPRLRSRTPHVARARGGAYDWANVPQELTTVREPSDPNRPVGVITAGSGVSVLAVASLVSHRLTGRHDVGPVVAPLGWTEFVRGRPGSPTSQLSLIVNADVETSTRWSNLSRATGQPGASLAQLTHEEEVELGKLACELADTIGCVIIIFGEERFILSACPSLRRTATNDFDAANCVLAIAVSNGEMAYCTPYRPAWKQATAPFSAAGGWAHGTDLGYSGAYVPGCPDPRVMTANQLDLSFQTSTVTRAGWDFGPRLPSLSELTSELLDVPETFRAWYESFDGNAQALPKDDCDRPLNGWRGEDSAPSHVIAKSSDVENARNAAHALMWATRQV